MLQLSGNMSERQVLSLRTGRPVAQITGPILNPDTLKIEGFYCTDHDSRKTLVLLYQDIRDVLPQGVVVNAQEVLTEPEELVRLQKRIEMDFELIGKPVETLSKEKVGKVTSYSYETTTMFIQKLYVSRSILKSLTTGSLSIDRTQIQEVTPKKVIISELLETAPAPASAAVA